MNSLISVIIPTYNRAHFLGCTLDSLLSQSYELWECLVIDDGSSDYTAELMDFYCMRDYRIKFYKRPKIRKKGASTCRNIGFEKSRGTYIQYLDSDDLLSENKFEEQLNALRHETSTTLLACDWRLFKINPATDSMDFNMPFKNKSLTPCEFLKIMGTTNVFLPPHAYMTPRKIIELAGGWNEDLTNNDDGEFFARIILNSEGVTYSNKTKVFYRKSGDDHLSNYNSQEKIKSLIISWELIEKYIQTNCSQDSLVYVDNAKRVIFNTIKNKFPYTTSRNQKFFSSQFKKESHRLNFSFVLKQSLKNYLRQFLYKSVKGLKLTP